MKTNPRLFFILIFSLSSFLIKYASGQRFIDLLEAGYMHSFSNEYSDSGSSFKYPGAQIAIQYPKIFQNGDILLGKLYYLKQEISDFGHTGRTERIYIAYLNLAYQKEISEKLKLKFALYPKFGSMLGRLNMDSFNMPVVAALEVKKSSEFSWGFGCMYNYEMFGHFVVPMILWDWKISDNWVFKGEFPIKGHVMYIPSNRFATGLLMSTSTATIRLNKDYEYGYMTRSYADAALFADLYITKSIVIRVKSGYSFMRSLDMFENGDKLGMTLSAFKFGDNRTQLNSDINDVPFFQLSLLYRYHY